MTTAHRPRKKELLNKLREMGFAEEFISWMARDPVYRIERFIRNTEQYGVGNGPQ